MDTEWIELFERNDELYGEFYKTNVESIEVSYIYVNGNNEIFYVNRENILLNEGGILPKEKLIYLLQTHKFHMKKRYKPISLLQYNYTVDSNDLLNSVRTDIDNSLFLNNIHYINDIYWKPTISFMSDVNSLHIVFYHDPNNTVKHNTTKRIRLTMQSDNKKTRKRT